MTHYVELDVRPILAAGGEPFGRIMETVTSLAPGEGLRLLAPFRPVPLFAALGSKGFAHQDREIGGGDWEVLFTPAVAPAATAPEVSSARWPGPLMHLDNRGLMPPEPMVKVLGAAEAMLPGEVMEVLLDREPSFLFPQLAERGHEWRGGFDPDGVTYRLLVRIGPAS
ncbi:MAG: universal stress protein [Hoeflea sp. BRH_c9]|nr:MAG: universal stress protein [Hoeflea sp. BRH_c9]